MMEASHFSPTLMRNYIRADAAQLRLPQETPAAIFTAIRLASSLLRVE
jgi:hypothetical protein